VSDAWRDPARPAEGRARALLAEMGLDEKLAQLGCVWSTQLAVDGAFSPAKAGELLRHGTGQVTRIAGATGLRPQECAAFANAIQRFLVEETRLGIPAIVHEESCAGFTARDATQLPQAIGLASTFDPDGVRAAGELVRRQMRAAGAHQTLAPVLDVARDPRWGRCEETFGEDPYLVSRMGVAYVRGVQGDDLAEGVAATGKHFLAYGAGEGGLNHAPAHVGPRELREVYARPFLCAIQEAGLATVMNAYNEVDGLACAGSKAILTDLLRGELGFDGPVVADYFSVVLLAAFHRVAADKAEAAAAALGAGLDVELPQSDCYGAPLREAIESGAVPMEAVDRSVLRVLRLKLRLGLFERWRVDAEAAPAVFDTRADRELARDLARRSLVLLQNEGGLLPLDPAPRRIAVVGPCADDRRLLLGDYHYPAHLEILYARPGGSAPSDGPDIAPRPDAGAFAPGPWFVPMVTILDGVRAAAPDAKVAHARGCDVTGDDRSGLAEAVAAARDADVAIVAVGGRSGLLPECTSGEFRDASDLSLTGLQSELVRAVAETGTPTVVVLVNGRVFSLPGIAERVPALLEAWLPGEEGGAAVADVLFGRANPAGRLPISLPRGVGQVPVYHGHKSGGGRSQMLGDYSDGPTAPLFPFGHGLSYTRFAYGALRVDPARGAGDAPIRISVDVANAGDRDGDEVVQLYVRDEVARVTRPVRQLVGFARVPIPAGAARRVTFHLSPSQLAFHDEALRLVLEPGRFRVFAGASSADLRAEAELAIEGPLREIAPREIEPTAVSVEPAPAGSAP